MKQQVLELIVNKPRHFAKIIKNTPEMLNWVQSNTKIVSDNFAEVVYSAIHDVDNICDLGHIKKFNSINQGYRFCGPANSCQCAAQSVSSKVSSNKKLYTEEQKKIINQKRRETTLNRYGVINNGQTSMAKQKHADHYASIARRPRPTKSTPFQRLNTKFKNLARVEFVTAESHYTGVSNQAYYQFKCLNCDNTFDDYIDNGHLPRCKICHPYIPPYISNQENQVYEFIKNLVGLDIQQSNKTIINPYELDIVIPGLQIAIEYCGLYWHSEANKADKNYHINKMNLCRDRGYRLITIFEDEWTRTPDIVKQRLTNILKKDTRIFARKCQIRTITMTEANEFIQKNHIQGAAVAKLAYGCYRDQQLIAVMTFGKPRYDKTADYELIRFCSIGTVVGGAGKLFSAFLKDYNPKKVISYCDMRWGTGNLYAQLKFTQAKGKLLPSYSYTDFVRRYHRSTFTKKTIAKCSDDFNKTEQEIMREKNIYRIWDCGQSKWIYTQ